MLLWREHCVTVERTLYYCGEYIVLLRQEMGVLMRRAQCITVERVLCYRGEDILLWRRAQLVERVYGLLAAYRHCYLQRNLIVCLCFEVQ